MDAIQPWMRRGENLGMLVLGVLMMAVCRAEFAPASVHTTNSILILEAVGRVEVLRVGATVWDKASLGSPYNTLYPGDQLRTGPNSRALIRITNLTQPVVGENSLVRIPFATEKTGFSIMRGIISFFHRDKPGELKIRTPTVSAITRGTEFCLRVDEDGSSRIYVLEGAVEMNNDLGQLQLRSGEAGIAVPNQAPNKTAMIEAINLIQWVLYYPAVLDLAELPLVDAEREILKESLTAYQQGDLMQALEKYPESRQPVSASEQVYFSVLLLSAGQVEKSLKQIETIKYSSDKEMERLAQLASAVRMLVASVKLQPLLSPTGSVLSSYPKSSTASLAESYYAQSRRNLPVALQNARRAVAVNPSFGFGWARVAELEFSFGHSRAAKTALDQALKLCPKNAQALALRGFVLAAQNQFKEASTAFDVALAEDSSLANAWLGRGLCKIRLGQIEAGREDLQIAATHEPERALLRSYLGKAFYHVGDVKRAEHELELAQKLDMNDPTAWFYAALLKQWGNRINEAIEDLEHSQKLNANRSVYRSGLLLDQDQAVRSANLATLYQDAGMDQVAMREAVRAVNMDYANYSAHLFLANSYDRLRDPKLADLRYETPAISEYLVANLLAPVGAGVLSPIISQQEYARFFERDHFGLAVNAEYLSRGDWIQSAALYGTAHNLGFSLDESYRSERGQRLNNDVIQKAFSFQTRLQLTPADTLYLQAVRSSFSGGDLLQRYNPGTANPAVRTREVQEPLFLAGYHHEWTPGVHSLCLASWVDDLYSVNDPFQGNVILGKNAAEQVTGGRLITMHQNYQSRLRLFTSEFQQMFQTERHLTLLGLRGQAGTYKMQNAQAVTLGSFFPAAFFAPATQDFTSGFERISLYGYHHWQVADPLRLLVGLSYDYLRFPENFRFAPLIDHAQKTDRLCPKAGLIWNPAEQTTVRAGYSRALGGVSFDQSFQLEPTQIAGFNQAWRSLIPESVAGANAAPKFDIYGLALEQRFPTRTYLGLVGEWRFSSVNRTLGVYDSRAVPIPFITPSSTPEQLHYEEKAFIATLNQLVGKYLSLNATYRLSQADLTEEFLAVPVGAASFNGFQRQQDLSALLHQLNLSALFNHRSGFFAGCESLFYAQNNRNNFPGPGDQFWQFNLSAGYRFPKRQAEIRLGLLNLTDQDYRLNPLNVTTELPRRRTLAVSLRFAF